MKKLTVLALVGVMAFTMFACGAKEDSKDTIIGGDPSTWGPELEEEEDVQVISPFVEYATIEEAKQHIDFDVVVPESLEGYDETYIAVMDDKMFEIIYGNETHQICIRKQAGDGDISGDFNVYEEENALEQDGVQLLMKSAGGNVRNVTWTNDGYAYSIVTDADMTQEDMLQLISQIQ